LKRTLSLSIFMRQLDMFKIKIIKDQYLRQDFFGNLLCKVEKLAASCVMRLLKLWLDNFLKQNMPTNKQEQKVDKNVQL